MEQTSVDEGREYAERLLINNSGALGVMGSSQAYQQVWARDSMICGFGLLLCGLAEGRATHLRSLETLRTYQTPLGNVPHHVGLAETHDPALIAYGSRLNGAPDQTVIVDTAHAGCIDGALWYIISHYYTYVAGQDRALLEQAWNSLERALLWLRYQDSNECGLLEAHEAKDWADLFANRYNTLYSNVLYYAAWRCMGHLAAALDRDPAPYFHSARDVHKKINMLLWVGRESPKDWIWLQQERKEWIYPLKRIETELVERPFYLPYVAFRDYADRFDTLGNLLAILFGVADQTKANLILDYIHGCGLNEPFPVQCLYPAIQPNDKDWREYYRIRNLNQPQHYHNGGAWPFIGGFYVAALVQAGRLAEAQTQLDKLAAMNRLGKSQPWGFNEWFHGQSGRPMGFSGQSWSAAMYIFAHDAVSRGCPNVFNAAHGWQLTEAL
jgi:glycogen debranching enzyme